MWHAIACPTRTVNTTRRQFVIAATAAVGLPQLGGLADVIAANANAPAAESFSFPLLGDIHFDRLEHHDMEWLKRDHPNDVRQVENYSRITTDVVPGLVADVGHLITTAASPVPFV